MRTVIHICDFCEFRWEETPGKLWEMMFGRISVQKPGKDGRFGDPKYYIACPKCLDDILRKAKELW